MVIPRRMHHAAAGFVHRTECAAHHVAHAVHQPDAHGGIVTQADRDGFAWHKLRLRRHDGAPRPALRQFIRNALFARAFGDFGHHQQFHQAGDKGAFARPHRPYNAQIHVAVGALGNIAIQIKRRAFHFCPSSASLAPPYEGGVDFILFLSGKCAADSSDDCKAGGIIDFEIMVNFCHCSRRLCGGEDVPFWRARKEPKSAQRGLKRAQVWTPPLDSPRRKSFLRDRAAVGCQTGRFYIIGH